MLLNFDKVIKKHKLRDSVRKKIHSLKIRMNLFGLGEKKT